MTSRACKECDWPVAVQCKALDFGDTLFGRLRWKTVSASVDYDMRWIGCDGDTVNSFSYFTGGFLRDMKICVHVFAKVFFFLSMCFITESRISTIGLLFSTSPLLELFKLNREIFA